MQHIEISDEVKDTIRAKYPIPVGMKANATYMGVAIYIPNLTEIQRVYEVQVPPPLPTKTHDYSWPSKSNREYIMPTQYIASMTEDIKMGFIALALAQMTSEKDIQRAEYGSKQSIVNMIWAMQIELGELSNELNIKPWKQYEHDTYTGGEFANILKECADVTAFFAALMIAIAYKAHMTPQAFMAELAKEYGRVAIENIQRHAKKEE